MTAFQGHLSKADINSITHVESSAPAAAAPKPPIRRRRRRRRRRARRACATISTAAAGASPPGKWRVRLSDLDTGNILFQTNTAARINSSKRYYVRFRIEVGKATSRVRT